MNLDDALAALQTLPDDERRAGLERLAHALKSGIESGENWTVFDPLECTPDMAQRCWYAGRTMVISDRVCAAVLDPAMPCPRAR